MKLKTSIHITRVLHVEVPDSVDPDEFQTDIGICMPEWQTCPRLKDGIPVDFETLWEYFENDGKDWHPPVRAFVAKVVKLGRIKNAQEILFHV